VVGDDPAPESAGLTFDSGADGKVAGFAIGGFEFGVDFENNSAGYLCASRIGTDSSGAVAEPNLVGVSVDQGADLAIIGGEACPEELGNLISGNSTYGITVAGSGVEIDGNLIGTTASGDSALPNGPDPPGTAGGGILVGPTAASVTIGGFSDLELHNTIAFNAGPGVSVDPAAQFVAIRKNSIHSNSGPGIESDSAPPELDSIDPVISGVTTVRGTLEGPPNTNHELEFFANDACESGVGEGRYFVASAEDEVETDATGVAEFEATLLALVLPARFFTATATASGETTAFSNCVEAPPAPVEPSQLPPPPAPEGIPTPVNGEIVTVEPKAGKVLIRLPGAGGFVPLEKLEAIPVGSTIDATRGRVTLASANAAGVQQSGDFFAGRFQVLQEKGCALLTLRLRGGDFSHCRKGSGAESSKRKGRRLWGSGNGRFRTEGNFGSASVRGTVWLTVDQCKGTFFKVRKGVVSVRDFVADKTLSLAAGKSYWAKKQQD
jgi:hypothetical protein